MGRDEDQTIAYPEEFDNPPKTNQPSPQFKAQS